MIAAIIRWSIANRFLVIIGTVFLIIMGIYALLKTPVDAIPDLSDVQVIVTAAYPGQSPQVVEDQVTYPLSTAMLAVPGAMAVRGYSYFGVSFVYIIFKDGTDLYWARSRVLEYLNQVADQMPAGVNPVLGPDATGVGWIYQYALTDPSHTLDIAQLTSLQNWFLKFELQTVPNVSEVATVGGMVKQYQVTLDPNRLRAYHLSVSQVKQAIQRGNEEVGGSVVEMGEAEYMVSTSGYLHNIATLKNIPLGVNKNGIPIRLEDVATIALGPEERRGLADLDGLGEVVGGIIVMRKGENALTTIEAVKAKLNTLKASLPKGVNIITTYDRSGVIKRAIDTLTSKLFEEFVVVSLICLLFLYHFRSSLVIIISLPIGVIAAFIVMYWQGINANILSLSGIALAVGAMVDAAIVMIENVHKHMETQTVTPDNRWQIIQKASLEVGPPLFFSLLIITLSFLPIFALQAQEGRLFHPLAFTKSYSMAAAAFLSITLVPVLMGYFIRGKIRPEHKNPINKGLIAVYRPIIAKVLRAPKTVLAIVLMLLVISYWPYSRLGSEFMPELNEGDWLYMPTTLPGLSIGKAQQLVQQMDRLIKTVPEVKTVFGKVGRAQTATDPAPITMFETVVQLKPKSEWRTGMTMDKIKQRLQALLNFPGVSHAWGMPIKTRIDMLSTGINTPVGIKISGPNLKTLQTIGKEIEATLRQVPGTTSVYADRSVGGRYIRVDINRASAARFGLNIEDVQNVVKLAIGGTNITQTIEGLERYPVNIRYPQDARKSVEKIKSTPIITPTGAHIPLADVARVYVDKGPPVVKSDNARPTSWVLVDMADVDLGGYVKDAQAAIAEHVKLPQGYTLKWTGQFEYMQRAKQRLALVVPLTLAIIMLLLYINFRKFTEVFIIMGTLPLALIGGFWFIYFLGYNLSVAVSVGFIALAGVAVEIGVIMLVYLNQALARVQARVRDENRCLCPDDIKDAVIEGAVLRVRPIMMTVSATIVGLLPIMIGSGTGSNVMTHIAAPMIGGMVSATVLTLVVIPAVFWLLKQRLVSRDDG